MGNAFVQFLHTNIRHVLSKLRMNVELSNQRPKRRRIQRIVNIYNQKTPTAYRVSFFAIGEATVNVFSFNPKKKARAKLFLFGGGGVPLTPVRP